MLSVAIASKQKSYILTFVAAVNNFYKVQKEKTKKELFDKPRLHKVAPPSMDYEKLAPYFLYRPKNVIKKALENTTQIANAVVNRPPRRHLKSRFLMLRHPRLNEVVATDTYFASTRSIEGYHFLQVLWDSHSEGLQ